MVKKLYAVDESGKPVPGALFTFTNTDSDGTVWTAAAFEGGQSGSVSIDTSMHQGLFVGNHITVTAPGYANAGTDADVVPDSWQFIMPANPSMVPALTLGALLTVGAVVVYNNVGKKKKVAGIDFKNDVLPYVIPGAMLIGGYLIFKKISDGLGITDSPEDKARQAALDSDIAAAGAPTMTASELSATANAIKEDLGYSSFSNNIEDAAHQLTKPANLADLLRLIDAFGKHSITFFGIPTGTYTLEEYVTRQLPADYISEINNYYAAQGINFKF